MDDSFKKVVQVLSVVERDGQILLGLKGKKMGAGRRSSPGGHLEESDESIEAAAKRETEEEIKVIVEEMEKLGVIEFEIPVKRRHITMHLFKVTKFSGEPKETDELRDLKWYPRDQLPIKDMWPDDEFWIPYYLEGGKFDGEFVLGEEEVVISHKMKRKEGDEFKVH